MSIEQIVLAKRPTALPDLSCFRLETTTLPPLNDGEVHVSGHFYSVDPYMRGRMNDTKSYIAPFVLDQPIAGGAVGQIVASQDPRFKEGDFVTGFLPWATESVVNGAGLTKIEHHFPLSYSLGILGMPGLTAYFGLVDIAKPKAGETVVVSGAAGAVGLIVGQIAKLLGCYVVGIAGSDEKIKLLKEQFGFDQAINYKTTTDLDAALATACPKGVDVYFDNVGGRISDAVLQKINLFARIVICGQISSYNNNAAEVGPRIGSLLLTRRATMQGFIIVDYQQRFAEGIKALAAWLKAEKLKSTETILEGFTQLPKAFLALFSGDNQGKMLVKR